MCGEILLFMLKGLPRYVDQEAYTLFSSHANETVEV